MSVDKNNPYYYSINNCIIDKRSGELVAGCATSIIPTDKNVTSIGGYAFASCPYLDDIYYAGSESGWTAVSKTGTWKNSSGDCTVHFAEVDPEPEPEPDPETDVVS